MKLCRMRMLPLEDASLSFIVEHAYLVNQQAEHCRLIVLVWDVQSSVPLVNIKNVKLLL
jgi:hypothetical protein